MPKLIAILAAVLVGAVVALGLCQAASGREGVAGSGSTGLVCEEDCVGKPACQRLCDGDTEWQKKLSRSYRNLQK